LPHGRFAGTIVNAIRFLAILGNVRMHPVDAKLGIGCNHVAAGFRALIADWDSKTVFKRTLDNVSRHGVSTEPFDSSFTVRYAYLSRGDRP
jgi:hypothetical protein